MSTCECDTVDITELLLYPRSTICISGPSNSGKSTLVYEILKHRYNLFNGDPPKKILFCYSIYQPFYDKIKRELKDVTMYEGMPEEKIIQDFSDNNHNIIILDDLGHKLMQNESIEMLFTQLAHHMNLTVVFILHNLFQQGKYSRTIALNTKYIFLFKSPRDLTPIKILGRQAFPDKSNIFLEAYQDAVSKPFGYLLVDFTPHVNDKFRLRSNIIPVEGMTIYM